MRPLGGRMALRAQLAARGTLALQMRSAVHMEGERPREPSVQHVGFVLCGST